MLAALTASAMLLPAPAVLSEDVATGTISGRVTLTTRMRGVPISTTHAITGAILGVGTTKGVRSVRWIWGQRIITAWILTIPCAAFMAAITYLVVHVVIEPFFGH